MIDVGDPFPSFSLQAQDGNTYSNTDFLGAKRVIFFYPKDDTPGCTTEACEFRDADAVKDQIIGVSPDPVKSHQKFAKKFELPFLLLADTEKELCSALGIWIEKSLYGRKYMGVDRTTYLIDEQGIVRAVWRKVKPEGHAAEVLKALLD